MARKQTNLAVAADVATIEEMLRIADQVYICSRLGICSLFDAAGLPLDTYACFG